MAVRRDTSAKVTLKIDTAVDSVTRLLEDIYDSMYRKYDVFTCQLFHSSTVLNSWNKLLVVSYDTDYRAPWTGSSHCGLESAK